MRRPGEDRVGAKLGRVGSRLVPVLALVAIASSLAAGAVLGADQDSGTRAGSVPKCFGKTATVVGTEGADDLEGRQKADVIVGMGGPDELRGRKGNDVICGGDGDDLMAGGKGNDKIFGGDGRDGLKGGPGQDTLLGGNDPNKIVQ